MNNAERQAARHRRSALGVGEPERGVGEPGQQRRGGHDPEAPLAPGAADDREQRVGQGTPGDQPGREPGGVDQVPDHAQQPPRTPQRDRHGQDQQRAHGRGRAPAEDGGHDGQRQDVRRCGDRRALADGVPGLDVELPPVPRLPGAGDSAPPDTAPNASRAPTRATITNSVTTRATGLVKNRTTKPLSSARSSSSSESARRTGVPASARLRGAPAFGDVGRLHGRGGGQVADEVQPVPVGQPPRREQVAYVVRLGRPATRTAPAGPSSSRGLRVERDQRRQLVERLPDLAHQQEADHPDQGAEPEPDHLERQPPGRRVDQQRVAARRAVPGSACADR